MNKQPTKEDIVEIIAKVQNQTYYTFMTGQDFSEAIYDALVQAGVIVDTKPSTINDENKPAEPKTIWVCNKHGMYRHEDLHYRLIESENCLIPLVPYIPQSQHTQALRRIDELQFRLNCLKHTIEEILFRTEEHSNEVNPKWIISECKQALTTDDEEE